LLLGAVGTQGSVAITPLAEQLAMDPTTLARNLKPLEREGLIEIAKGKDRRTRIVKLTERGQETLVSAFPLWEQAQTYVIEKVGADRQRAMLGDLKDLASKVRK
jgi:DNA-binding MarR family transcriptional regulator